MRDIDVNYIFFFISYNLTICYLSFLEQYKVKKIKDISLIYKSLFTLEYKESRQQVAPPSLFGWKNQYL